MKKNLVTIIALRACVCNGVDFQENEVKEVDEESAKLLIALGKARKIEGEGDIKIEEDLTVAIEDMTKADITFFLINMRKRD